MKIPEAENKTKELIFKMKLDMHSQPFGSWYTPWADQAPVLKQCIPNPSVPSPCVDIES